MGERKYPIDETERAPRLTSRALAPEIETLVRRFKASARPRIRRMARASPRLADLAIVFPGAVYALAADQDARMPRRRILALIEDGAPLRAVARALSLPLWLRRLPPEAFSGPLPALPAGEQFARRIANRLPRTAAESAFWLSSVAFAASACHEDFALWLAEQPLFAETGDPARLFGVLSAYAWFSGFQPSRAHGLIVVPWRPEIAFDTALCAAKSWFNRLRLVLQLGEGAIADPWLARGSAMGFSFTPLIERRAILEEAQAMQNCADQYADRIARDKCRLFSVRRDGERAATLEIGPHGRETGVLTITQLKARHNMPAPLEVWQAAHAWLATQNGLKRLPSMMAPERPLDAVAWRETMRPFRAQKNGAPWLAESPLHASFAELDAGLAELARRGGVSSWLFT